MHCLILESIAIAFRSSYYQLNVVEIDVVTLFDWSAHCMVIVIKLK